MSAADIVREWLEDYTATKDAYASAMKRMKAQEEEIARLKDRVAELELERARA